MKLTLAAIVVGACVSALGGAIARSEDTSTISWCASVAEARKAAEPEWKPILIFGSADGCADGDEMLKRVFADEKVCDVISREFVIVCVNAADLPPEVAPLVRKIEGDVVPFVAYVTPDGELLRGTRGLREVEAFTEDLDAVAKDERLDATRRNEAKLAKGIDLAQRDIAAKRYASALSSANEALQLPGRSASRKRLHEIVAEIEAVGRELFQQCIDAAIAGDFERALALAKRVEREFRTLAVEKDAAAAVHIASRLRAASMDALNGNTSLARKELDALAAEVKEGPFVTIIQEKLRALTP
ncbi:MAG: thioredoxin family protein [Planctomycetes bacterium]|nr:thioredoxin family protein [Planctomycetota bacterium]MBI3847311.1 thioredoxin family protein [Planctomycetota bacterium]